MLARPLALLAFISALALSCDGGGGTCGAVGQGCATTCPDDLACSGEGPGFCASPGSECGGFSGAECEAPLVCAYLTGSSAGVCLLVDELACICERQPGALGGC